MGNKHSDSEFVYTMNLASYNTKFTNLKIILNKYQPICVSLQETRTKNIIVKPSSQYNIVTSSITRQGDHERGTVMLIHRSGTVK